jgi:peptide/nickel transport system permease protein
MMTLETAGIARFGMAGSRNWLQFRRSAGAVVGLVISVLFLLAATVGPFLTPYDPNAQDLTAVLQPPSPEHLLGTDSLGRDLLSRVVVGSRVSLLVSLSTVLASLLLGTVLGLVAGFYGGWLDSLIMRTTDVLQALPGVLLAIMVIAIVGVGLENVIVAISLSSLPAFARLARGATLSAVSQEYVDAARLIGASDARILTRHILPNILAPLIVMSTLRVATVILTASGLSFLGLGVQPPTPEWGAMVSDGRSYLTTYPHVAIIPGLAITLVVLGFNLLGDGLRDALDPRLRT